MLLLNESSVVNYVFFSYSNKLLTQFMFFLMFFLVLSSCFFFCSYEETFEHVVWELFNVAKSKIAKLRHFALQFVVALLYMNLDSLSPGDNKVNS